MISSIANSLGVGAGIDTAQLVSDLAAASRQPKIQRISDLSAANQAKISALAQVRSDLESFAGSLAALVAGGSLRSQPIVSDSNVLAVSVLPGTPSGKLSSQITIEQLAQGQTSYTAPIANASDPIAQGTLMLNIGGTDHAIVIDATNNTLAGLGDAINSAGTGIAASIVTDADGARLVLKGPAGEANAFTLSAAADAPSSLASFTTAGMIMGQHARNALFNVDGVAFSQPDNMVTDALPGITLTLKQVTGDTPVTLGSARPLDTLRETVGDFVSVFNTLKADLRKAMQATGGNHALRTLNQQLAGLISQGVTSHERYNSLSDIGLSTNRDGSIRLDATKLENALKADPDAVEAIFLPVRDASHDPTSDPGIAGALTAIATAASVHDGALYGLAGRLQREAADLATARQRIETREDAYRQRLERQFGAMDARLGAMKAKQNYLEQQIRAWSGSDR